MAKAKNQPRIYTDFHGLLICFPIRGDPCKSVAKKLIFLRTLRLKAFGWLRILSDLCESLAHFAVKIFSAFIHEIRGEVAFPAVFAVKTLLQYLLW